MKRVPEPLHNYPPITSGRSVLHVASSHCFCGPVCRHVGDRLVYDHRPVERVEAAFEPFGPV